MPAALRPLRIPAFPRLAGANLVNELGNWLGEIALAILVFDQTGSPLATAALFVGIHFVPAIATPPLVARIEHLPAARSLGLLYGAEALAFGALAVLAADFLLPLVLLLAAADGAVASAARALTRAAAAGSLKPAGLLREGNAILNIGFTAGAAAGPAIAGLVVAGAGVQVALAADAVSFLIVAALLATARGLPAPEAEAAGVLDRLREGVSYVRRNPLLRRLMGAQALAFVFFAVVIPIEVVFAKETLGAGDSGYGALLASWGVGMVMGSLAFAVLGRVTLPVLLAVSTLAIGGAYLATSVAPTLLVACAASVVGGIGNGVQWVALVTAIQAFTANAYQARVVAMLEAVASAMPGVGFVLGGAIAATLDPRASYAVAGAGVVIVLIAAIWFLRGADWSKAVAEADGGEDAVVRETAERPPAPGGPTDTIVSA